MALCETGHFPLANEQQDASYSRELDGSIGNRRLKLLNLL